MVRNIAAFPLSYLDWYQSSQIQFRNLSNWYGIIFTATINYKVVSAVLPVFGTKKLTDAPAI